MRPLKITVASLLSGFVAFSATTGLQENDTFWHLGLGRAVWNAGARTVREPWALPDEYPAQCTVPEWLWDLTTYGVLRAFGWVGLAVFFMVTAASVVWALAWALSIARPRLGQVPWATTLTATSCVVCSRTGERPEQAALALGALFLAASIRHAHSAVLSRTTTLSLFVLALLWAQIHPTCVLVVPLFALPLCARWLRRDVGSIRADLALLVALALLPLSSAHGFGIYHYVLAHASGDAVAHITDMQRTPLSFFDPRSEVFHPLLVGIWLCGGVLQAYARRFSWESFLLLLFGMTLTFSAVRGVAFGGVLSMLWLADGLEGTDIAAPRRAWFLQLGVSLLIVTRLAFWLADKPHLRWGLAREHVPLSAAAWLAQRPPGARVMTDYTSGAPLAFLLDGRVRTWVDSRTPMYFDATDFALQREGFHDAAAVVRASARFGFDAAVVRRESSACQAVAESGIYTLETTELGFSLFVRRGGALSAYAKPLRTVAPCGPEPVPSELCGDAGLADDVAALTALDPVFARFLRATRLVRCGGDLRKFPGLLPKGSEAVAYGERLLLLRGAALLAIGQSQAAQRELLPLARAGNLRAVALLVPSLRRGGDERTLRALLRAQARELEDATPGELMRELAQSCVALKDWDCAAFYGLRAAARGVPQTAPVLRELAAAHPAARIRRSAARYLQMSKAP